MFLSNQPIPVKVCADDFVRGILDSPHGVLAVTARYGDWIREWRYVFSNCARFVPVAIELEPPLLILADMSFKTASVKLSMYEPLVVDPDFFGRT